MPQSMWSQGVECDLVTEQQIIFHSLPKVSYVLLPLPYEKGLITK